MPPYSLAHAAILARPSGRSIGKLPINQRPWGPGGSGDSGCIAIGGFAPAVIEMASSCALPNSEPEVHKVMSYVGAQIPNPVFHIPPGLRQSQSESWQRAEN